MHQSIFNVVRSVAISGLAFTSLALSALTADEVNIYSYRQPELVQPLLDAFTKETGIKANVIFAKSGLAERIKAEGSNSPADVILTVDIGRLDGARTQGITQALHDATIETEIPVQYRDPTGHWFGLTSRARVIYASKDRVPQETITYEELADPKWRGRLCTRSGQHVYSIGLFASMLAHHGEKKARAWLEGVKANLARKPTGNDRAQAQAIYAGQCDIALGNTYYMGLMQTNEKEPEQKEWASSLKVLFPNAQDRGTHVNISGMALALHAPNRDNAIKLMQYLASPKAQEIYAEVNHEYPVTPGVHASKLVQSWGALNPDTLPLADIAAHRRKASLLVDEVGFDEGAGS